VRNQILFVSIPHDCIKNDEKLMDASNLVKLKGTKILIKDAYTPTDNTDISNLPGENLYLADIILSLACSSR
jgi:hypothetical protein